jgi:chorismate mutase-like protein
VNDRLGLEELEAFRRELDEIDSNLIQLLGRRFEVIESIAQLKRRTGIAVNQPIRVGEVMADRAKRAEAANLPKMLIQRLWQQIIAEACRVENRVTGDDNRLLTNQAIRIDHIAIAVRDIEVAIGFFTGNLGFELRDRWSIDGNYSGMDAAVINAGGASFVLVAATSPHSNVAQYIDAYGPGVQHVAIEVDDIDGARAELEARGFKFIGGIYDVGGLKQMFSRRDPNSGMQIEIVSRGASAQFEKENVRNLFSIMEHEGVF